MRLRRDLRDAEHLTACMERVNLVTAEKVRELSRMNNKLYECLLKEEARPEHDQVVSHVIIKADVRGSTKMTQDLLAKGLSPASHFSLNLHEPVKRLLERYSAKKVFIEGDAIVLAIFETEASRAYARPVAKACALSKQILAVCNSYNDGRLRANCLRSKWGRSGVPGLRANLLDRRGIANHDFQGAESLGPAVGMLEIGQAHALGPEDPDFPSSSFSPPWKGLPPKSWMSSWCATT